MFTCNKKRFLERKVENKYIFFDLESGEGHLLDEVGTAIFDAVTKHDTERATEELLEVFEGVEREELRHDIEIFVKDLTEKGVI